MTKNTGFYISITNNSILPMYNYEGLVVPLGLQSNIAIQRNFFYKLPSPYSNCRDNVETPLSTDSYYYKLTAASSKYTRNLCLEVCLQYKYIIAIFNCSSPSIISNVNNVTVCVSTSKADCAKNQRDDFSFNSVNCDQYCPETCERIAYSEKVYSSNYPSE